MFELHSVLEYRYAALILCEDVVVVLTELEVDVCYRIVKSTSRVAEEKSLIFNAMLAL